MGYEHGLYFLMGLFMGFILSIAFGALLTYKATKKAEEVTTAINEAAAQITKKMIESNRQKEKLPPIIPVEEPPFPEPLMTCLNRLNEISREQSELAMSLDGPLRSALDAKNKKQNVGRIHMLDQEKFELLNKMLTFPESKDIRFFMQDLSTGNTEEKDIKGMIDFLKKHGTYEDKKKEKPHLSLVKPDKGEMH